MRQAEGSVKDSFCSEVLSLNTCKETMQGDLIYSSHCRGVSVAFVNLPCLLQEAVSDYAAHKTNEIAW